MTNISVLSMGLPDIESQMRPLETCQNSSEGLEAIRTLKYIKSVS